MLLESTEVLGDLLLGLVPCALPELGRYESAHLSCWQYLDGLLVVRVHCGATSLLLAIWMQISLFQTQSTTVFFTCTLEILNTVIQFFTLSALIYGSSGKIV
jgi:hypothetical protein